MQIVAIHIARVAAFLEVDALDPQGRSSLPDNLAALVGRYNFPKYPQSLEDMDLQKGITFSEGMLGDIAIMSLQVFQNGIIVDTRSSTDNSIRVFDDLLHFAKERNGATVIRRRYHLTSQITFRSDLKLSLINPFLQPIANRLSAQLSETLNHPMLFEPTAVIVGPQTWSLKIVPTSFTIERRAETPLNENTYFSSAPLPTSEHVELIEEIERTLTPR